MEKYIPKAALVAEIERFKKEEGWCQVGKDTADVYYARGFRFACERIINVLNTLEGKDPYEQSIQYPSVNDGIKAHAETYSFNIESELFNQLTKEQQKLWRKEIEQACISGGEVGVELARDPRYKENLELKEVDLLIHTIIVECCDWLTMNTNLNHDKIEGCRNLMLAIKDEQLKA